MLRMPENREASSRLAGRMEFEALHTASKMKKAAQGKDAALECRRAVQAHL